MKEYKAFPKNVDIEACLDFYFQCCSTVISCHKLAVIASTYANGGVCPLTNDKVFEQTQVKNCLSLMSSCGMYDYSGQWAYSVGLPAKSGVSGGIMIVVPNVMGICIWSPKLDQSGNSYRGIQFARQLINKFMLHVYDNILVNKAGKKDPKKDDFTRNYNAIYQLLEASSKGDLRAIIHLRATTGLDLDVSDYDKRTALHLACAEGHTQIVQFLLTNGADPFPYDRWNNTPLDDARRHHKNEVITLYSALVNDDQAEESIVK